MTYLLNPAKAAADLRQSRGKFVKAVFVIEWPSHSDGVNVRAAFCFAMKGNYGLAHELFERAFS